jgi:hypothetical protein
MMRRLIDWFHQAPWLAIPAKAGSSILFAEEMQMRRLRGHDDLNLSKNPNCSDRI